MLRGPGSLLYPEALLKEAQLPDKDGLAIAASDVRALALRCDDFHEVCEDDAELGEVLLAALAAEIATRRSRPPSIGTAPRDRRGQRRAGERADRSEHARGRPTAQDGTESRAVASAERRGRRAVGPEADVAEVGQIADACLGAADRSDGHGRHRHRCDDSTAHARHAAGVAAAANRASTVLDDRPPQDRASTVPEDSDAIPVVMPRTDTKNGPAVAPRLASSPGERLIVPQSEAGLANDQLDEAFDGLSRDPVKRHEGPDGMRPPARLAKLPLPAPIMEESEVLMEAEEPPTLEKGPSQIAGMKTRAIGDHSEPEISIERFVELEVEEPMNESSSEGSAPEIMIVTPGRAITADDTHLVSGSIDSEDTSERSAKKQ